ncbi:MAG: hypothetical protein SOW66_05685 [Porphyromonas sp.]|nr:hypothetical protein [Porphyromonas sp.]
MSNRYTKDNIGNTLPAIEIPKIFRSADEYLASLVEEGATIRYGNQHPIELTKRIKEELQVIRSIGGANYFLFYHNMVKVAKEELGIWVGPGRNNSAGSVINYCLGITSIDPIKHGLLWERFMGEMVPDIDLDLDEIGRDKLLDWLKAEYGDEHVAHLSTSDGYAHLCGIVVTCNPLRDYTPLVYRDSQYSDGEQVLCTEVDGLAARKSGLVQIDLLSYNVLSVLKDTVALIKERQGIALNLDEIAIDDAKTFELLQSGQVRGTFFGVFKKYHSVGLHPANFEEMVALFALSNLWLDGFYVEPCEYIEAKRQALKMVYESVLEEQILSETYGLMIYQEQFMRLVQDFAALSKTESYELWRALRKEDIEAMNKSFDLFFEKARQNGRSKDEALRIFNKYLLTEQGLESGYSNKAHAVCYTWMAYQLLYLKVHFPQEYFSTAIKYCKDKEEVDELKTEYQQIKNLIQHHE